MKYLLSAVFLLLGVFVNSSFSCTLAGKVISIFDEDEYIFIGDVVGYTPAVKSTNAESEGYGLIVKVKESVYLPKTPKSYFEVFPLDLYADCSQGGVEIDYLKKKFPINSEIRVIAKESAYFYDKAVTKNIRLENSQGEIGQISLNFDNGQRLTSSKSIFDYKNLKSTDSDAYAGDSVVDFEIRKDLLRLKNTTLQKETNLILDRLIYAPAGKSLAFYELLKNYAASEAEANRYYEMQLKMTDSRIFAQYVAYQQTLSELVNLGYQRKAAEKALETSLGEGVELTVSKLLKRSLQILSEK